MEAKNRPNGPGSKGQQAESLVASIIEKHTYLEDAAMMRRELSTDISFLEYFDLWIQQKRSKIELATYENYQYRSKGIIRYFQLGKSTTGTENEPRILQQQI